MKLIDDIHHLAFVTHDMDRLIAFYDRVFSARVTADLMEDGLRHCFIEIGSHTVLHPFQIPGVEPETSQPMFRRGRLDHFALNATSEAAFHELRRRLVAEGASNGVITDMGSLLNLSFTIPTVDSSRLSGSNRVCRLQQGFGERTGGAWSHSDGRMTPVRAVTRGRQTVQRWTASCADRLADTAAGSSLGKLALRPPLWGAGKEVPPSS
jgi:catechol 2,3-dioxygenase-like lactoylglutathione lyase family enzyme